MMECAESGARPFFCKVMLPNTHMEVTMAIEAYCVKCKAKKVMQDPIEGTTKNGKPITKGKCPDCGTTICRIGAAK